MRCRTGILNTNLTNFTNIYLNVYNTPYSCRLDRFVVFLNTANSRQVSVSSALSATKKRTQNSRPTENPCPSCYPCSLNPCVSTNIDFHIRFPHRFLAAGNKTWHKVKDKKNPHQMNFGGENGIFQYIPIYSNLFQIIPNYSI